MQTSLIITDNFYNNPDEVRNFALSQEFGVKGNFPGNRTRSFLNDELKFFIEKLISPHAGKVTYWGGDPETTFTGAFQYTTSYDKTWIHADNTTTWAGVCYLTPNAPHTGGTGLFRHKGTGYSRPPRDIEGNYDDELLKPLLYDYSDLTKWDLVDVVGNVYNRLVLYRGDLFHASLDYFGHDLNTGRLFQTFFFSTEK